MYRVRLLALSLWVYTRSGLRDIELNERFKIEYFQRENQVYFKIPTFALAGFSPDQMDAKDTAIICAHYPAGCSAREVLHYAQEVESGWFRNYDFGKLKNRLVYDGSLVYQISKISAPLHIFYSSNDWLVNEKDVGWLIYLKGEKFWVPIPTWNNLDYLFGKDAPRLIYKRVINVLSKYEQ